MGRIQETAPISRPASLLLHSLRIQRSLWLPAWGSGSGLWADKEDQGGPLIDSPHCPAPLFWHESSGTNLQARTGPARAIWPDAGGQGGELARWGEGDRMVKEPTAMRRAGTIARAESRDF